jgi:hypothetical protein
MKLFVLVRRSVRRKHGFLAILFKVAGFDTAFVICSLFVASFFTLLVVHSLLRSGHKFKIYELLSAANNQKKKESINLIPVYICSSRYRDYCV